jgi:hypothetical protein
MREFVIGLFCLSPFILFFAGWYAHAFLSGHRLRSPIAPRETADGQQQESRRGLFGKEKAWEP